jgi:hypothetical protein
MEIQSKKYNFLFFHPLKIRIRFISHYLTTKPLSHTRHKETPSFKVFPLCVLVSWSLGVKNATMSTGHKTPNMERNRNGSACPERSRRKESPPVFGRFIIYNHHDSNQNQIDGVVVIFFMPCVFV